MLLTRLLQPDIQAALGRAGHGARVLIADGNYPFSTQSPAAAQKVFLNLRRGLVRVTDVLDVLRDTIPIESALIMQTPNSQPAAIHEELCKLLPAGLQPTALKRAEFYREVCQPATALVIATGEERRFANILITIGVVKSEQS
jgi:L-fucose mutarotase